MFCHLLSRQRYRITYGHQRHRPTKQPSAIAGLLERIQQPERCKFATVRIAQHHFKADEVGLAPPWPLLGAAAQATQRIRVGTAAATRERGPHR
ncbi:MAG: LLM class flavin-dependent oxidoreductase [Yaniella sp.]|uniref:LLM class flavin-dependent oxidoreductase n=1 Tax=Yaniella sp. TaxID=2773929 RepID=UPI00264A1086|nr:LLM class flavin-dependent oxidoreductase [Yaniella sp.]MDN5818420.1 LLM class flavin-dependent oxidoreductase [Yaniella sp.]MDN6411138.1 LLM class flavin-dependent oxidoreductase [Yaniella sp.]MDN6457220.1 LLM class flavin-dependent oxidoreductase [Yaniella sp.]MDN6499473.1 LLM class flavin-dependent oxidoreductase [Yaniella sp.]MDN6680204.1 LLM class flavin-dependent oxidoreductase [Yaniella sp.]